MESYGITAKQAGEIAGGNMQAWHDALEYAKKNEQAKKHQFNKPARGLRPRKVADKKRLQEINNAIFRYMDAVMKIPQEWYYELTDILGFYTEFSPMGKE